MTKKEKTVFKSKYNNFWSKLGVKQASEDHDIIQIKRNKDKTITVVTWYMRQTFYRTKFKELKTTLKEVGPFEYINKEESRPSWKPVD